MYLPKPLLLFSLLLFMAYSLLGESEARPIVLVYGGGEDEFTSMLAELIEGDDRVDAEVLIVNSARAVRLASAMPNLGCILIYADHREDIGGLPGALTAFFEGGGGLVGMREVCYEPSAEGLAMDVFPIHGNHTLKPPRTKRAFTYVLDQDMEIAEGLPDTFEVLSLGTYISADLEGNHLEIPGEYRVVYRDSLTGSPLVVAHQSEKGGRSVAIPGVMVVKNPRVDVYYGNLFRNENFTTLLTNSVVWAMGNSRFTHLEQILDEKIDEFKNIQDDLMSQADKAEKKRRTRRTYSLIVAWSVGLAVCGAILIKLVLASQE